jgi:hypothetical protein
MENKKKAPSIKEKKPAIIKFMPDSAYTVAGSRNHTIDSEEILELSETVEMKVKAKTLMD